MTTEEYIEALQSSREGYDEEAELHQFLVDAYTGGGGFRNGQVPCLEAPYWGRAAYEEAQAWASDFRSDAPPFEHRQGKPAKQTWSWLSAFYGEDAAEYRDRVDNAVYMNPVAPIVDVVNAFLTSEDSTREGLSPDVERWVKRVNPLGHSMRQVSQSVCRRGQVVGFVFTVVDTPAGDQGGSRATSREPSLSVFWPQQIKDWDVDEFGRLVSVKFCTRHCLPRASLLDKKREAIRYTLWYPDHWERVTLVEKEDDRGGSGGKEEYEIAERAEGPNPLGRVPVTIFRWSPLLSDDAIKGQPQIHAIGQIARDIFNMDSERRHLHRMQAFSLLVMPGGPNGPDAGTQAVGPGNFTTEDEKTKNITRFVGPSAAPFEAYSRFSDERKGDLADVAMLDRGLSRQAETAEARRLRFQRTNMMLSQAAQNLSDWERQTLILVSEIFGVPSEAAEKITVTRKDDYAIQQFSETLDQAVKVADLSMAPACAAEVINAVVVDGLLSNLTDERRAELRLLNERHLADKAAEPQPNPVKPPVPAQPGAQPNPPPGAEPVPQGD